MVHQNRENAQFVIGEGSETVSGRPSPRIERGGGGCHSEEATTKKFKSFNFQTLCPFLAIEDRMVFDDMLCLEWSAFSFQEKRGGGRGWRPEQPTNYFSPRSDLPWRAVAYLHLLSTSTILNLTTIQN